jgi:hypothetical protein
VNNEYSVYQLFTDLAPGGISKVIRELAKALSEKGHTTTVLQGNPFNLAREEMHEGFKIIRVDSPIEKYLWVNRRLFFLSAGASSST